MKKVKTLINSFFNRELPMELVQFNIITIAGLLGGCVAIPANVFIHAPLIKIIAVIFATLIDVVCIYLANYKKQLRSATIAVCFVVCIILFPVMYFTGGGINSGMVCWFALGTLFIFMLLDGMDFFFMLLTDLSIILGCYIVSYFHPEYIIYKTSVLFIYIDIMQSLIITTVGFGAIIRFQLSSYSKLYELAQVNNDDLLEKTLAAKRAERVAQSATEAKSNFLANMSHEIRTPINTIMGMDEMILRETSEKKVEEYALDIKAASNTLLTLINDILDITKIESGKMNIIEGDYDFMSLMHDILNGATMKARDKNIEILTNVDANIPCRMIGDDVRIKQIITNIIINAIKYTHEGHITISIECSKNLDNTVDLKFAVADTGIGIKPEDIKRIFESFERIEVSRNRNIEGAGLGMTITKNLLRMMDSNLKVESEYGKGSTFSFILTQKVADTKPIGDFNERLLNMNNSYEYTSSFEAPEAHFLIVDDNAMNRKVFVSLLKETRVQITEASSGEECLNLIQQRRFDMIFLDHMMPEMDGVETFGRMHALSSNKCKDTPVIALTANAIAGAKERYLAMGFHGFLAKPIVPALLEKVIRDYIPENLMMYHSQNENDIIRQNRKEEVLLAPVEGIDWDYALIHLSNSDIVIQSVIDFYDTIDYVKDEIQVLYVAVDEEGLFDDYRIKVHGLKSMANTIGATSLGALAKLCEYAARDKDIDRIRVLNPILMSEVDILKTNLSVIMDSVNKPLMQDDDEFCALLEMLKMAVNMNNTKQADNIMHQLTSYSYSEQIQQQIEELNCQVLNLNMETALQIIETLQK